MNIKNKDSINDIILENDLKKVPSQNTNHNEGVELPPVKSRV